MTRRGSGNQLGAVKWVLIIASVAASLIGARLAAVGDAQAADARGVSNQITVYSENGTQTIELPGIPTVVAPDQLPPVARSRSSR